MKIKFGHWPPKFVGTSAFTTAIFHRKSLKIIKRKEKEKITPPLPPLGKNNTPSPPSVNVE
jgi:hypothetical protein